MFLKACGWDIFCAPPQVPLALLHTPAETYSGCQFPRNDQAVPCHVPFALCPRVSLTLRVGMVPGATQLSHTSNKELGELSACGTTYKPRKWELMNRCFPSHPRMDGSQTHFIKLLRRSHRIKPPVSHSRGQLDNRSLYRLSLLPCFISLSLTPVPWDCVSK